MLRTNQSLASTALGLFCINTGSTMAPGQSQFAGVPGPITKPQSSRALIGGFFSLFLLLTKVQTVLNAKLKQMGEVLSRVSEHYT